MTDSKKIRIDQLLVRNGLVESRELAQRYVMAGQVWINGQRVNKSSECFDSEVEINVQQIHDKYVSRGGYKLEAAIEHFNIPIKGRTVLDIGASTGGFTDCLLQHGAAVVVSIDVGHSQLHEKIRAHPKVRVLEHYNARHLQRIDILNILNHELLPNLITADVSFISLEKVLPASIVAFAEVDEIVVLFKPQFELERKEIGKKGLVRADEKRVYERIFEFEKFMLGFDFALNRKFIASPIEGKKTGNQEYLMRFLKRK